MSSKESSESRLQINQIVLLVAAITGGVWLYEGPLKSSRPVHSEDRTMSAPVVDLRVEARLWQDPFEAVDTHIKVEASAKKGGSEQGPIAHSHQLKDMTAELADSFPLPIHVHVLAVLADGSPHAESRETRLRQRFAVLSGLERAGYTPVDSEHIRFFHWPDEEFCQDTSSDQQGKASLQMYSSSSTKDVKISISVSPKSSCSPAHGQAGKYEYWRQAPVPVEWYRSSDARPDVLVFWIKDQDLGNRPIQSLRAMQRMISDAFAASPSMNSFKVIGPRFSGTLQAMLDEIGMTEKGEKRKALSIYSPWSTAPENFLIPYGHDNQSVARDLERLETTFNRTIPTDDQLIDTLFDELARRGVTLKCESETTCNHIAVISEWDTLYGRLLPELVRGKISVGNNGKLIGFHQYSYLRGLDGELPQTKSKNNSEPSSADTTPSILSPKDRQQDVARMERPEGRSQLDYVRQLTELIREKEERIRAECGLWKKNCPGFKAIGVLGSDVYDKLLILQALKKSFPHIIFFTTDLDARLFHPSELAWTRNLVVASHFDLKLNEKLQKDIPPFRDTYQTATFFTILRALDVLKNPPSCQGALIQNCNWPYDFQTPNMGKPIQYGRTIQPKLHEIGRNGPVDISVPNGDSQRLDLQTINTVRPSPAKLGEALTNGACMVAILLLAWILLIPVSTTIFQWSDTLLTKSVASPDWTMIGLVLFAALFSGFLRYLGSDPYEGEPFSLFDGVSIWPSQILRGMVVALSPLFLWWIYHRSRQACEDLGRQLSEVKHSRPNDSATQSTPLLMSLPICFRKILNVTSLLRGFTTQLSRLSISSWSRTELSAKKTFLVFGSNTAGTYIYLGSSQESDSGAWCFG